MAQQIQIVIELQIANKPRTRPLTVVPIGLVDCHRESQKPECCAELQFRCEPIGECHALHAPAGNQTTQTPAATDQ